MPAAAGADHHLARGLTLVVNDPLRRSIACTRGTLWITHDGDPRDVVLEAGASHVSDRAATMRIHALHDAVFVVR